MKTNLTPQDLISFEEEIGECFNNAQIRAPIHLYSGNEEKIIKIFEDVATDDNGRRNYQEILPVLDSSLNVNIGGSKVESNIFLNTNQLSCSCQSLQFILIRVAQNI